MTHKYSVRYTAGGKDQILTVDASSPVRALDRFHFVAQMELGYKPDGYEIKSLALYYNEDSTGRMRGEFIESVYDIPKSKNPEIQFKPKKEQVIQTEAMPFLAEAQAGRLAE